MANMQLIAAGVILAIIDMASYGFKLSYANITTLGWILYAAAAVLIVVGIFKQ